MSKKRQKAPMEFSNFGFSTILLSFVMICIVTISAISLLTANSDYNLSKKVAEKNTAYYLAEEEAYQKLAEIDYILAKAYYGLSSDAALPDQTEGLSSASLDTYYTLMETGLEGLNYGSFEKTPEMSSFSYEVEIAQGQTLKVTLILQYPTTSTDTFYKIARWQSNYETTTHEEEILNLFQ